MRRNDEYEALIEDLYQYKEAIELFQQLFINASYGMLPVAVPATNNYNKDMILLAYKQYMYMQAKLNALTQEEMKIYVPRP